MISLDTIQVEFENAKDKMEYLQQIRDFLHELSPVKDQPVDNIRWVPIEKVQANDYNPNSVAHKEMGLLYTSIKHDGYTQPVVVIKHHKHTVQMCDTMLTLDTSSIKNTYVWNFLENQVKQQSPTPQGLLMPMAVSTVIQSLIDTQLEHSNQEKMMVNVSLNKSQEIGELAKYTLTTEAKATLENLLCTVGQSPDWKNVTTLPVISVGFNELKKSNQKQSQNTINLWLIPNTTTESGILLRINTSEKIGIEKLTEKWAKISDEAFTLSEPDEILLDYNVLDDSKYVIVDGFHRYFTCKSNPDILEANQGRLPIVVIKSDINDRMASTVRHNRARGKHSIDGMSSMVFKMLENGWSDAEICKELGMEAEELLRLKHITGFSKLFEDTKYKQAWETQQQIRARMQFQKENS